MLLALGVSEAFDITPIVFGVKYDLWYFLYMIVYDCLAGWIFFVKLFLMKRIDL